MNAAIGIGAEFVCVPDLKSALDTCVHEAECSFLVVPLVHPRRRRGHPSSSFSSSQHALTRSDLTLSTQEWTSHIVGAISSRWMYNLNSAKSNTTMSACIEQEMEWATHLGLCAVVFPTCPSLPSSASLKSSSSFASYARLLQSTALSNPNTQIWVRTHVGSWAEWHKCRRFAAFSANLVPMLLLDEDVPPRHSWQRWLGENIAAVQIPLDLFTCADQGGVTLSPPHAALVVALLRLDVRVIFSGAAQADDNTAALLKPYQEYIRALANAQVHEDADFTGYRDYLQAPLQPLMDNLSSQTYDVFERDSFKYTQYEEAIYRALSDREASDRSNSATDRLEEVCIVVAGAGRGPLVNAALRAAQRTKIAVHVVALEKNPNAIVTLLNLQSEVWGSDRVTVMPGDMRHAKGVQAHILVSELLGSFGDNELSPECLDGAQHLLRSDGISIPSSYTSYVAPITCSRLWSSVQSSSSSLTALETPHVVKLHNFCTLAASQPCFTFCHPRACPEDALANVRECHLRFELGGVAAGQAMLHGFAGYFTAVLYDTVTLSIEPASHSPGMHSWFPLFLPLHAPLALTAASDAHLDVHLYRKMDTRRTRVWYEWAVDTHTQCSAVHNPNGRSYWIGL